MAELLPRYRTVPSAPVLEFRMPQAGTVVGSARSTLPLVSMVVIWCGLIVAPITLVMARHLGGWSGTPLAHIVRLTVADISLIELARS